MGHFQRYCTPCHGNGGLGDGSAATSLKVRPANLTEPHTALHTAGDMFWWLTRGIPQSGMPAFSAELTGQDRWDVVNFLRAFSEGFQARILTPDIAGESLGWARRTSILRERQESPWNSRTFATAPMCFSYSRRLPRKAAWSASGSWRG